MNFDMNNIINRMTLTDFEIDSNKIGLITVPKCCSIMVYKLKFSTVSIYIYTYIQIR